MTATEILFGFEGRISRALFNAGAVILALVAAIDGILIFDLAPALLPPGFLPMAVLYGVVFFGALLAIVFCALAVKRLHDLDRSASAFVAGVLLPFAVLGAERIVGTSALLHYAALAAIAWAVVDLALTPGTPGPNRFGRDPLAFAPRSA